ncbi:MAG: zinc-ribbon domain-containing protein [Desulforudis sp.]|nr:MAG: zinc-ribbon domain-containing protein [Desulforudis sp.]
MALINCKECGRQISNKAEVCPHCGAPSTAKKLGDFGQGVSGCGCALTILGLGILFFFFIIGLSK